MTPRSEAVAVRPLLRTADPAGTTATGAQTMNSLSRSLCLAVAAVALTAVEAAATPTAPAEGAMAPGTARVWFYRTFFPGDTPDMPAVAMNGQTVGYARPGYSFYRDVPAGAYHVTVASFGQDINQAKDLALAPGTQIYVAIQSDPDMIQNKGGYRRSTYYVGIEPLGAATAHLGQTSLSSGY